MCSGMMFTASGMLTKQTSVQHPFGNAADEFRNAIAGSGRSGMGSVLKTQSMSTDNYVNRQVRRRIVPREPSTIFSVD